MSKNTQEKKNEILMIKSLDIIQPEQKKDNQKLDKKIRAPSQEEVAKLRVQRKIDANQGLYNALEALNNFYHTKTYTSTLNYLTNMHQLSSIYLRISNQNNREQMILQNKIQRSRLKLELLEIYYDTLNEVKDKQNVQKAFTNLQHFIFQRLFLEQTDKVQDRQIKTRSKTKKQSFLQYSIFKLRQQEKQIAYRRYGLQSCFKEILNIIRNTNQSEENKNTKILDNQFIPSLMDYIYMLTACQSFVTDIQPLKAKLEKLVKTIKQSWYIAQIMTKFLRGRKENLSKHGSLHKECPQMINFQTVQNILKQFQVVFVDHASTNHRGYTYILDQDNKFPAFINFFKLIQVGYKYDEELILSYALVIILHQLAHWMIRKLNVIPPNDDSFPDYQQKLKKDTEKQFCKDREVYDGGWIFQKYLFGDRVEKITSADYNDIFPLLKLTKSPDLARDDWDIMKNWDKMKSYFEQDQSQKKEKVKKKQKCENQVNSLWEVDQSNQKYLEEAKRRVQEEKINYQILIKEKIKKNFCPRQPIRLYRYFVQICKQQGNKQEESEQWQKEQQQKQKQSQKQKQQQNQISNIDRPLKIEEVQNLIKLFQQLGTRSVALKASKDGARIMTVRINGKSIPFRMMEMPDCQSLRNQREKRKLSNFVSKMNYC